MRKIFFQQLSANKEVFCKKKITKSAFGTAKIAIFAKFPYFFCFASQINFLNTLPAQFDRKGKVWMFSHNGERFAQLGVFGPFHSQDDNQLSLTFFPEVYFSVFQINIGQQVCQCNGINFVILFVKAFESCYIECNTKLVETGLF